MKLLLVIPSLDGGGAERVMTALANAWVKDGHMVTLVTLAAGLDDKYRLAAAVRRVALDVTGRSTTPVDAIGHNLTRIRALRREINLAEPDAIISFLTRTNVLVLIAAGKLRGRVVVSERSAPGVRWIGGVWRALARPLYRRAAAVVAQTRRCADQLQALAGCAVEVIPNPVAASGCEAPPAASAVDRDGPRTLLAVGRLVPKKGFDLLIAAFAQVAQRHPAWRLEIVGEGRLRHSLARAIRDHGLADRISLPGFIKNVRETMQRADLFVLPSLLEGFPNALLEAMAEGKACISFDCEMGPRELITHGENGWLVPTGDTRSLAVALDMLMQDDALRAELGARAREVCNLYSTEEILGRWNALLARIGAGRVPRAAAATRRMV
jgi:glycosyltransferase involved in cell wall biosynthesis